ncbi:Bromodomain associated [Teratosphaeria destructans]|uniref:Bromodomain associated n=1 Tax=Teratosphaeria destructans TaxID=418781 RepID=A0A9W7T1Y5_9PEZI|nr:Bromodomain associated [Teratosphaeria destructans]
MSQAHDLHRALLRPAIIHILRAAGYHSTKPSVLETLTNIAERYLMLLASTTAAHANLSHSDSIPGITDVRMALTECGVLLPAEGGVEEEWREIMRVPVSELAAKVKDKATRTRIRVAEKRKRDERDTEDIRRFKKWFEGSENREIRRVAGMIPDASATGSMPAVGVGGGLVQAEDFLTVLKKRYGKGVLDDGRLAGTVLGGAGGVEEGEVVLEGGPVQRIGDWRPRQEERFQAPGEKVENDEVGKNGVEGAREDSSGLSETVTEPGDAAMDDAPAIKTAVASTDGD